MLTQKAIEAQGSEQWGWCWALKVSRICKAGRHGDSMALGTERGCGRHENGLKGNRSDLRQVFLE